MKEDAWWTVWLSLGLELFQPFTVRPYAAHPTLPLSTPSFIRSVREVNAGNREKDRDDKGKIRTGWLTR